MRRPSDWTPRLAAGDGALAERLAAALADDIARGRIAPGDRLPAHRDLAWRLEIGLGTVTRAYALLERRGLVVPERGRGMFVAVPPAQPAGPVDLCVNTPPRMLDTQALRASLARLAARIDMSGFGSYTPSAGTPQHRAMMARWLARDRLELPPSRLMLTSGAQHALAVAIATTTGGRPGTILTESLTYPGIITIARHAGHRLQPVMADDQGMCPDALDRALHTALRDGRPGQRLIYVTPTLHNPTAASMSRARREAISGVAAAHDAVIVEDDVYGVFAAGDMPPLTALAPDRCLYVSGLSKSLSPGLRIGALAVPPAFLEAAADALAAGATMAPPLGCLLMESWLEDGTAEAVEQAVRAESRARTALARRLLGKHVAPQETPGFHIWLPMPRPRAEALAMAAAARGIRVTPPSAPMVDDRPGAPAGLRLCLGGPSPEALTTALNDIARLVEERDTDPAAYVAI
ncbi:PLP-dependent aminotransferase family protein [Tistrella mobilis]|uniref:HTH gntR-type domain-containing protein n=1 Tax=Tistrella mobilis TaxID=171437 RepID=A0A162KDV3_9PROT|nr:PLP-dependent aminotransferase family protein [Tistrella mobilis]KYO51039.1 hypothetical protein AUP44_10350 [Tistrella mobilis]